MNEADEVKGGAGAGPDSNDQQSGRIAWGTWALVVAILLFMGAATFGPLAIVDDLRDPAFARGLITVMITLTVIALVMSVVLFSLLGGKGGVPKARVELASAAAAGLLGILGTIVGFYFATGSDGPGPLSLSPIEIERAVDDSAVTVLAFVSGGKPPYRWEIDAFGAEGISEDGWITHAGEPGEKDRVVIEIRDSSDASAKGEEAIPALRTGAGS